MYIYLRGVIDLGTRQNKAIASYLQLISDLEDNNFVVHYRTMETGSIVPSAIKCLMDTFGLAILMLNLSNLQFPVLSRSFGDHLDY